MCVCVCVCVCAMNDTETRGDDDCEMTRRKILDEEYDEEYIVWYWVAMSRYCQR